VSDSRPDPESELTPAQDDAVRKLLASARHTEPAPPDVVARLDAALAALNTDRLDTRAPVVTLASRRRRTAASLLLAAAAVVVAGVGIGQVLPSNDSASDSAGSTAAEVPESAMSDDDQMSAAEDSGGSAEADSGTGSGTDEKQSDSQMRTQSGAAAASPLATIELTSDARLKPQVRALRPAAPFTSSYSADPACVLEPDAVGDHVSVTFDGDPGVLIYSAPVAGLQQVELYLCGQPGAVRSLRLRAP
jgi:hypothetical protein